MILTAIEIQYYVTKSGRSLFIEWFEKLDYNTQNIVRKRLRRIELGQFGDCENVGGGVFELRIHYASGYRIYFAYENKLVILLILAGDKATQMRDIKKAKMIWEELKNDKK